MKGTIRLGWNKNRSVLNRKPAKESARQKTLANELEWIRKNPKARQAKSKARINAYEELLSEASKEQITQAYINIPMTDRLGDWSLRRKIFPSLLATAY